ncbi:Uncharacterised protein [Pandoraea pulmonicola]|uniref:Secreted protein n=1 Tax=Pandoraea pulmonicola TaxID=93221 RepID=A0AAJ4ZDI9_PANPU|nr:Uncharacterised protein [Pandoraea pulmonicola]
MAVHRPAALAATTVGLAALAMHALNRVGCSGPETDRPRIKKRRPKTAPLCPAAVRPDDQLESRWSTPYTSARLASPVGRLVNTNVLPRCDA